MKKLPAKGIHRIVFEKKDGSIREMACTRDPEIISEYVGDFQPGGKKDNPAVQTVYDLEKKDWRCFRKENLRSVDRIELVCGEEIR
jgi:hypothetical protein